MNLPILTEILTDRQTHIHRETVSHEDINRYLTTYRDRQRDRQTHRNRQTQRDRDSQYTILTGAEVNTEKFCPEVVQCCPRPEGNLAQLRGRIFQC